jgi:dolichol-phosphate mannosyltransferase
MRSLLWIHGSTDSTWKVMQEVSTRVPTVRPVQNTGQHGFGQAIIYGIDSSAGDSVVIMMANESDYCRDVVRYWHLLGEGYDAVFGSRLVRGGGVIDHPAHKLLINRMAHLFLRLMFHVPFNDFTNAFKAFRRKALDGRSCRRISM